MKKINVLSLFDGMSCGQIALNKLNIPIDKYFASEIDKSAITVTMSNFPSTIQLGDVKTIKGINLPKIDLLIGGSPCQGFSYAGKMLNFSDERSKLFFEYVRLLKEIKPKYFLLENVKMKKEYQDVISECLGVEPIEINSSLVSAQNRVRLYWTNIPEVKAPIDKNIYWSDICEDITTYKYTDKSLSTLKKLGINDFSFDKNESLQKRNSALQTAKFNFKKSCSLQSGIAAMRGRYIENGVRKDYAGKTKQYLEFRSGSKTNCLTTVSKDNVVVPHILDSRILADEYLYRYLTPLECERLQTVPDNYTDCVSNIQRCRMLGNGWTVDVIAHILSFLDFNNEETCT